MNDVTGYQTGHPSTHLPMSEDVAALQHAEKRLLEAMDAAIATVSSIRRGDKSGAVEACSEFLTAIEESRSGMLEAANKHGSVIPYKYNAGAAMVRLAVDEDHSGQ